MATAQHARRCGQPYVVDLRIGTPHAASRDRDLELAGKVIEIAIPRKHSRCVERQRRSIANLVRVHSRDREAGNISRDIAAGAGRVQSHSNERIEYIWQRLDRDPVQLNVLPHCDVGDSVSISVGKVSNGSELFRRKQTIGDPDSHHEALQRLAFPVLAAGYACPVTLRVHTPPAEIGSKPLWRNGPEALACEAPNFFEALP